MRMLLLGALLLGWVAGDPSSRTRSVESVPRHAPRLGTISFTATGVFGDENGDGSLLVPLDVTAEANGDVYVLEHDASCVLHYSPDGEYLGRIGRHGEGPGELRRPRNLAVDDDDRIAVFDLGPRRFCFFDAEGGFLGTRDYQGDVRTLAAPRGGSLVGVFRYPERDWIERGMMHRVVLFAPDTACTILDSMRILSHQIVSRSGETTTNVPRPFAPGLFVAALPSGWIVTAHGGHYRLQWHRPDGSGCRILERKVEPQDISAADRAAVIAEESEDDPVLASALRSKLEFPRHRPAIEGLAAGPDGQLLVLRPGAGREFACDIYSGDGEFLGTVHGPRPDGRLRFVRGDLYVIDALRDDFLPTITRHEVAIEWPPSE